MLLEEVAQERAGIVYQPRPVAVDDPREGSLVSLGDSLHVGEVQLCRRHVRRWRAPGEGDRRHQKRRPPRGRRTGVLGPVRITFDTGCAGRVRSLEVTEPAVDHSFLPPDWGILEVKVDRAVPAWLASLLSSHGCRLQRVSKYCAALAAGRGIRVEPLVVWPVVERGEPPDG